MNPNVLCRLEGRLGNNLFQAANGIAYAARFKATWAISSYCHDSQDIYRIGLPVADDDPGRTEWREPDFGYHQIPEISPMNVAFKGFFQSYRYFEDHAYEVSQAFKFPEVKPIGRVSIHVRRTDLIGNVNYPPLPLEYYKMATQVMVEMGQRDFLVFSDDIEWSHLNLPACNDEARFEFCDERDPILAMATMAACEHHIIANSTFSWWAAWLDTKSKLVICPRKELFWGEPMWQNYQKDLIPPDWMTV